MKGIYPRVPPSFKRLNDGGAKRKVYYHTKDIAYLSHDKLIDEFRIRRTQKNKISHAKKSKNTEKYLDLKCAETQIDVSHVIRDKYPTFDDAINDLDDCLTTCSAFLFMNKTRSKALGHINLARRLLGNFYGYFLFISFESFRYCF